MSGLFDSICGDVVVQLTLGQQLELIWQAEPFWAPLVVIFVTCLLMAGLVEFLAGVLSAAAWAVKFLAGAAMTGAAEAKVAAEAKARAKAATEEGQ